MSAKFIKDKEDLMPKEEKEEDVYNADDVDELLDDDEIKPQEAAFMRGYDKEEETEESEETEEKKSDDSE